VLTGSNPTPVITSKLVPTESRVNRVPKHNQHHLPWWPACRYAAAAAANDRHRLGFILQSHKSGSKHTRTTDRGSGMRIKDYNRKTKWNINLPSSSGFPTFMADPTKCRCRSHGSGSGCSINIDWHRHRPSPLHLMPPDGAQERERNSAAAP
jgi:hypothetical protein